jgi:hypothetical protein
MKHLLFFAFVLLLVFSCKKDTNHNSDNVRLVRSIWTTSHKLNSSGRYYTTIDSFVYDDQKSNIENN